MNPTYEAILAALQAYESTAIVKRWCDPYTIEQAACILSESMPREVHSAMLERMPVQLLAHEALRPIVHATIDHDRAVDATDGRRCVNVRVDGKKVRAYAKIDGSVLVWDEVARHFTRCHNLTPRQIARVRSVST